MHGDYTQTVAWAALIVLCAFIVIGAVIGMIAGWLHGYDVWKAILWGGLGGAIFFAVLCVIIWWKS